MTHFGAIGRRPASGKPQSIEAGQCAAKTGISEVERRYRPGNRPSVETRYSYYQDSDKNRFNRYSLSGNFSLENQKYGLSYRHTDASDPSRDNRAEDLLFKVYSRLTDTIGAGAGIGFTQLGDGHTSNFPTGHLRVDAKLFGGTAGANLTREVLSDTAELIENRIRMTVVGLYLSHPVTERFSLYGNYNYKSFSDSNHANEL